MTANFTIGGPQGWLKMTIFSQIEKLCDNGKEIIFIYYPEAHHDFKEFQQPKNVGKGYALPIF